MKRTTLFQQGAQKVYEVSDELFKELSSLPPFKIQNALFGKHPKYEIPAKRLMENNPDVVFMEETLWA